MSRRVVNDRSVPECCSQSPPARSGDISTPEAATLRQDLRHTFALFFPDVSDDKLDTQRIMIKDIVRVAALLKEKITAEEVGFLFNRNFLKRADNIHSL